MLLIDADPQGSIKTQFGLKLKSSQCDFSSFLIDDYPFEEAVQKVSTSIGEIDIVISSRRLSDADIRMSAYPRREETLKLRFKKNNIKYDYVVIDTSPAMNIVTLNVLIFSDYLLIPTTMDAFALSNIKYLIDQLKIIKDFYEKTPTLLGILPTIFDKRISVSAQGLEAVKKAFEPNIRVFSPIGIDSNVKKAQIKKKLIYDFPQSRAAKQYSEMTQDIIKEL